MNPNPEDRSVRPDEDSLHHIATEATSGSEPGQPSITSGSPPPDAPSSPPASGPAVATAWRPQDTRDPRRKSATLAVLLSLMPGLGQVYVGYYRRGFLHILVIASLITMLANDFGPLNPLLGLGLAFFWLYNMVDAGRRAAYTNMLLQAQQGGLLPEEIDLSGMTGGSRAGGIVLILLGFLFLMNTRFDWDFRWLEEWWPLGFILLGAWLVYKDVLGRTRRD
jgi:TM2 domain-containing membrane protein YozV